MNAQDMSGLIKRYLNEVTEQYHSGQAKEHAYRPALQRLMSAFDDIVVINDPKRSEHGAPDFVFQKKSNPRILKGYAEAKDIGTPLDKIEKSEQMQRYHAYSNLFLTDYLEFRFFRNGEKYKTISLGTIKNGRLQKDPETGESLIRELEAFLAQTPERITSGLRLAQIMGGRARRLRDNVREYLGRADDKSKELTRIFNMMKELLVHDLTPESFADMYAQTLVYGLFVARYSDPTSLNFTRNEARDLVPKSNPFLLQFFDHIVGPNFDTRLAYIVDELCEIFSVSDVQEIVHKHLRVQDDTVGDRDPIIHFYEDFLQAYDPDVRKKMGAYYTPVPVVRYIIRQVDRILKEDLGILQGIASDETILHTVPSQPYRRPGDKKDRATAEITVPRVQILDPALGTATFLNETIKYIYQGFKGQEGRWPAYVNNSLVKRLFGFELMMAPYTIAHMKLAFTLRETGVTELDDRLGIYLTNTLEEGIPLQPDLFSFGLSAAVSEESRLAAEVKSQHPVMVVIGNPPYSISSENKSKWILNLIADYKVGLNERKINLDDDYIKFIRFAEYMIEKNSSGIVGVITNNSYIDGITHRQMRKHLLETFDRIYVLDLHGSTKKKEVAPDGTKDENVFNIQQGVAIVFLVKVGNNEQQIAKIYHSGLWGTRFAKFDALNLNQIEFRAIEPTNPNFFFVPKDFHFQNDYMKWISVNQLFVTSNSGFQTKRDKLTISYTQQELNNNLEFIRDHEIEEIRTKFKLGPDGRDWTIVNAKSDVTTSPYHIQSVAYRPFDNRFMFHSGKTKGLVAYPRHRIMSQFIGHDNLGLATCRQQSTFDFQHAIVVDRPIDMCFVSLQTKETGYVFPLYLYQEDGTTTVNFDPSVLSEFIRNLDFQPSPEDVFDYIYAVLHSPSYREKYKEFLKIDFPRVPIPTQAEFDRLVPLGCELRELHLMKSLLIDQYPTTFPVAGDCLVEKVSYGDEKVQINKTQYFGGVPELVWNFYIGGYQPAQKWLKDRKGRHLDNADLVHYQRIIKILLETDRLMQQIG